MNIEFPGFEVCMAMLRTRDRHAQEDAFDCLLPLAGEYVAELIEEFEREKDQAVRWRLLELVGSARSPAAFEFLVGQVSGDDQQARLWATWGLKQLGTNEARALVSQLRWSFAKRIVGRTITVAAALAAVCFGLVWVWQEMTAWPLRGALPRSASDVHEWGWQDGFLPDYTYVLKARITPDEFRAFVERKGLTPHTPTRKYEDSTSCLGWRGACHENWWNPSDSLDGTFVANHGDLWTYAKYEDGYIYVKSLDH